MMVDSINSVQTNNLTTPLYESSARDHREHSLPKEIPTAKNKDSVDFQFSSEGNLRVLQRCVNEIAKQILKQFENYFGWIGENDPSIQSTFTPPDNASAQEIIEFYNPDNTTQRYLDLGLGFFDAYLQNQSGSINEDSIEEFYHLLGDAFNEGFDEAEDILGSFDEMGKIGDSIKRTYDLVMEGLEEFRLEHLNELGLMPEPSDNPIDDYVKSKIQDLGLTL
ncbi:MAG: DUF5610 domain-containing protein [Candidatus Omnitrophica bacterium]|nr:DUF5610 domain-containing protein [Candidatus Omnitrophota bacterium]